VHSSNISRDTRWRFRSYQKNLNLPMTPPVIERKLWHRLYVSKLFQLVNRTTDRKKQRFRWLFLYDFANNLNGNAFESALLNFKKKKTRWKIHSICVQCIYFHKVKYLQDNAHNVRVDFRFLLRFSDLLDFQILLKFKIFPLAPILKWTSEVRDNNWDQTGLWRYSTMHYI